MGVRMRNHRYNRIKNTIINLWYNRQDWFGAIRVDAAASFASV